MNNTSLESYSTEKRKKTWQAWLDLDSKALENGSIPRTIG